MDMGMVQMLVIAALLTLFFCLEGQAFLRLRGWYVKVRSSRRAQREILECEDFAGMPVPQRLDLIASRREALIGHVQEGALMCGLLLGVATIGIEVKSAAGGIEALRQVVGHATQRIALCSTPAVVAWVMLVVIQEWKNDLNERLRSDGEGDGEGDTAGGPHARRR